MKFTSSPRILLSSDGISEEDADCLMDLENQGFGPLVLQMDINITKFELDYFPSRRFLIPILEEKQCIGWLSIEDTGFFIQFDKFVDPQDFVTARVSKLEDVSKSEVCLVSFPDNYLDLDATLAHNLMTWANFSRNKDERQLFATLKRKGQFINAASFWNFPFQLAEYLEFLKKCTDYLRPCFQTRKIWKWVQLVSWCAHLVDAEFVLSNLEGGLEEIRSRFLAFPEILEKAITQSKVLIQEELSRKSKS